MGMVDANRLQTTHETLSNSTAHGCATSLMEMIMQTVIFIHDLNKDIISKNMETVPRIGDTIPLFCKP